MSLSNNFPTIAPSLSLDFANVKALDPRITFTRTTTATYYDGVTTAKAEQNLLKYSQAFTDASWTDTDCTVTDNNATAPDGTSTAATMLATNVNAVLTQGYTAIAGSYTFSVWLRRVTGTGDIEIAADNGTWTTKVITGTWARYDVTQTVAAGSKTAGIRIVTNTDEIEVWGAQLEQRSAVSSYTATTTQAITNYIPALQTAASGVARFDHNPTTGESLGLLIEEQRTNLVTYSAEFDNAAWTKSQSSITANTIVAPDGTLTGDRIVENTAASQARSASQTTTTTASTTYTLSVFAKEDPTSAKRYLRLALNNVASTANWAAATFNLATGVVEGTNAVGTGFVVSATSITPVGNGWYRCSISGQIGSNTDMNVVISCNPSTGTYSNRGRELYTGDGYSGIFVWGAQIEAGAFPTSYIATTSASVTRNADAASMTGANFSSWYRQDEGTMYGEFMAPFDSSASTFPRIFEINDGTIANRHGIFYRTIDDTNRAFCTVNSVSQAELGLGAYTYNSFAKVIYAYQVNNFTGTANGSTVQTDTSGILPTVNQANIGSSALGGYTNGYIRKISFYPASITNAQLQALTS